MLSLSAIQHHVGFMIQDTELNGFNGGSNAVETGDIVFLHGDGAAKKTTKVHGNDGTHSEWRRMDEANGLAILARTQRVGTIGVVKRVSTNGATGDEIVVIIQGDEVNTKVTQGSVVALVPQQPLYVINARGASATAAKQTVRLRSALGQSTINGTTILVCELDGLNGFGYDDAT